MKPIVSLALVALVTLSLSACGFHLRHDAQLPAGMQQVHLDASGSSNFRRALTRALEASGSTVVDEPGPGVAEMRVPVASFSSNAVTITGQGRISEYALRFHVRFDVVDAHGKTLVPVQNVNMSREYTYDASHAIGQSTQSEVMRHSMVQDMVRAVMFRLQAAAASHPTSPASVSTASVPAAAASVAPATSAP